jgi:hypothetical protein
VKLWRNGGLPRKRSHSGQEAAERQEGFEPSLLRPAVGRHIATNATVLSATAGLKTRHRRDVRLTWRKTIGHRTKPLIGSSTASRNLRVRRSDTLRFPEFDRKII